MRSQHVVVSVTTSDQVLLPANPNRVTLMAAPMQGIAASQTMLIAFGNNALTNGFPVSGLNTNSGSVVVPFPFTKALLGDTITQPVHMALSGGASPQPASIIEGFV